MLRENALLAATLLAVALPASAAGWISITRSEVSGAIISLNYESLQRTGPQTWRAWQKKENKDGSEVLAHYDVHCGVGGGLSLRSLAEYDPTGRVTKQQSWSHLYPEYQESPPDSVGAQFVSAVCSVGPGLEAEQARKAQATP